ncbi:hypothetical protein CLOP_g18725 [Closterium sp. NIES-67]|nr:hypothetical protein CLOP_g18725 [Closterium sp. NIES-67]
MAGVGEAPPPALPPPPGMAAPPGPPAMLPPTVEETVPLSLLTTATVQQTMRELRQLSESLATSRAMAEASGRGPDDEKQRKVALLKFLWHTRQKLLRLLVIAKWCNQLPVIERCKQAWTALANHDAAFVQAADGLWMTHAQIQGARAPLYDVPTAVEILSTHAYRRLPACVDDLQLPPNLMLQRLGPASVAGLVPPAGVAAAATAAAEAMRLLGEEEEEEEEGDGEREGEGEGEEEKYLTSVDVKGAKLAETDAAAAAAAAPSDKEAEAFPAAAVTTATPGPTAAADSLSESKETSKEKRVRLRTARRSGRRAAIEQINSFLRTRLLETPIPPEVTRVRVGGGKVRVYVEGEYQADLTLGYASNLSLWRVIKVKILVRGAENVTEGEEEDLEEEEEEEEEEAEEEADKHTKGGGGRKGEEVTNGGSGEGTRHRKRRQQLLRRQKGLSGKHKGVPMSEVQQLALADELQRRMAAAAEDPITALHVVLHQVCCGVAADEVLLQLHALCSARSSPSARWLHHLKFEVAARDGGEGGGGGAGGGVGTSVGPSGSKGGAGGIGGRGGLGGGRGSGSAAAASSAGAKEGESAGADGAGAGAGAGGGVVGGVAVPAVSPALLHIWYWLDPGKSDSTGGSSAVLGRLGIARFESDEEPPPCLTLSLAPPPATPLPPPAVPPASAPGTATTPAAAAAAAAAAAVPAPPPSTLFSRQPLPAQLVCQHVPSVVDPVTGGEVCLYLDPTRIDVEQLVLFAAQCSAHAKLASLRRDLLASPLLCAGPQDAVLSFPPPSTRSSSFSSVPKPPPPFQLSPEGAAKSAATLGEKRGGEEEEEGGEGDLKQVGKRLGSVLGKRKKLLGALALAHGIRGSGGAGGGAPPHNPPRGKRRRQGDGGERVAPRDRQQGGGSSRGWDVLGRDVSGLRGREVLWVRACGGWFVGIGVNTRTGRYEVWVGGKGLSWAAAREVEGALNSGSSTAGDALVLLRLHCLHAQLTAAGIALGLVPYEAGTAGIRFTTDDPAHSLTLPPAPRTLLFSLSHPPFLPYPTHSSPSSPHLVPPSAPPALTPACWPPYLLAIHIQTDFSLSFRLIQLTSPPPLPTSLPHPASAAAAATATDAGAAAGATAGAAAPAATAAGAAAAGQSFVASLAPPGVTRWLALEVGALVLAAGDPEVVALAGAIEGEGGGGEIGGGGGEGEEGGRKEMVGGWEELFDLGDDWEDDGGEEYQRHGWGYEEGEGKEQAVAASVGGAAMDEDGINDNADADADADADVTMGGGASGKSASKRKQQHHSSRPLRCALIGRPLQELVQLARRGKAPASLVFPLVLARAQHLAAAAVKHSLLSSLLSSSGLSTVPFLSAASSSPSSPFSLSPSSSSSSFSPCLPPLIASSLCSSSPAAAPSPVRPSSLVTPQTLLRIPGFPPPAAAAALPPDTASSWQCLLLRSDSPATASWSVLVPAQHFVSLWRLQEFCQLQLQQQQQQEIEPGGTFSRLAEPDLQTISAGGAAEPGFIEPGAVEPGAMRLGTRGESRGGGAELRMKRLLRSCDWAREGVAFSEESDSSSSSSSSTTITTATATTATPTPTTAAASSLRNRDVAPGMRCTPKGLLLTCHSMSQSAISSMARDLACAWEAFLFVRQLRRILIVRCKPAGGGRAGGGRGGGWGGAGGEGRGGGGTDGRGGEVWGVQEAGDREEMVRRWGEVRRAVRVVSVGPTSVCLAYDGGMLMPGCPVRVQIQWIPAASSAYASNAAAGAASSASAGSGAGGEEGGQGAVAVKREDGADVGGNGGGAAADADADADAAAVGGGTGADDGGDLPLAVDCRVVVSPDDLWPHTQYLEECVRMGDAGLLIDAIRLTAAPLHALHSAIRPLRSVSVPPPALLPSHHNHHPAPLQPQQQQQQQPHAQPSHSSGPPHSTASAGAAASTPPATTAAAPEASASAAASASTAAAAAANAATAASAAAAAGASRGLMLGATLCTLLPGDISIVPRGPFSFRIIYRHDFAIHMRCFGPDFVWLQPAPPPKTYDLPPGLVAKFPGASAAVSAAAAAAGSAAASGAGKQAVANGSPGVAAGAAAAASGVIRGDLTLGGSLPCPQFRPFILEQVSLLLSQLDRHAPEPPPAAAAAAAVVATSGPGRLGRTGPVGESLTGGGQPPIGPGNSQQQQQQLQQMQHQHQQQQQEQQQQQQQRAEMLRWQQMAANLASSVRAESHTAMVGLSDDGGYGGAWVPVVLLKRVLRSMLRYLGTIGLFARFPSVLAAVLGPAMGTREAGLLSQDPEQPALRFFIGNYVYMVNLHRHRRPTAGDQLQLMLQVVNARMAPQRRPPAMTHDADVDMTPAELAEISDLFSRKVAVEPFDVSRLSSFVTLVMLPLAVIREFMGLLAMRREQQRLLAAAAAAAAGAGVAAAAASGGAVSGGGPSAGASGAGNIPKIHPATRVTVDLCFENRIGLGWDLPDSFGKNSGGQTGGGVSAGQVHPGSGTAGSTAGNSADRSDISYSRADSRVDFSLVLLIDHAALSAAHLPVHIAGGAGWLAHCVSVRLRLHFSAAPANPAAAGTGATGPGAASVAPGARGPLILQLSLLAVDGSHGGKGCWSNTEDWDRCKQLIGKAIKEMPPPPAAAAAAAAAAAGGGAKEMGVVVGGRGWLRVLAERLQAAVHSALTLSHRG